MDQDAVLGQFEILEKKIEQLIAICKRREAENEQLRQNSDLLEKQLREQAARQKQNDELKELVRSKIDSLMGRLSEFKEE